MRREYVALADDGSGFFEGLAFGNQFTAAFQGKECRVAFVHMPDSRIDPEGAHGADAADTEEDLLGDPGFQVGGIKLRGKLLVVGAVSVDRCIQQIQRNTADLHLPDPGEDIAAGELDRDRHFISVFIIKRDDRKFCKVEIEIRGLLPSVFADLLDKITLIVDEADRIQRKAHVTGFLQMITGQDTQTAGICRDRFMQTEFK